MTGPRTLFLLGLLTLGACSVLDRDRPLHDLRTNQRTPEEFGILPVKPLETPADLKALPQPTPGGDNRTDPTPLQDAVAALGGNAARLTPGDGVPSSDGALIAHARRNGVQPDIRASLSDEDRAFRRSKSLFTWSVVPRDDYNYAYRRETLDPYVELGRWRRAGVRTPSATPQDR